jgi:hypothetical protein
MNFPCLKDNFGAQVATMTKVSVGVVKSVSRGRRKPFRPCYNRRGISNLANKTAGTEMVQNVDGTNRAIM